MAPRQHVTKHRDGSTPQRHGPTSHAVAATPPPNRMPLKDMSPPKTGKLPVDPSGRSLEPPPGLCLPEDHSLPTSLHFPPGLLSSQASTGDDAAGPLHSVPVQRSCMSQLSVADQSTPKATHAGKQKTDAKSIEKLVRAEAEFALNALPKSRQWGGLPLRKFLSSPSLKAAVAGVPDVKSLILSALSHNDSRATISESSIVWQASGKYLRKSVEDMFVDGYLAEDPHLRLKVKETKEAGVPLDWFCSRYGEKLRLPLRSGEARLIEALAESSQILADERTLTLIRRAATSWEREVLAATWKAARSAPAAPSAPAALAKAVTAEPSGNAEPAAPAPGRARKVKQLNQLLEFYFEPFSLQHNRFLLDLVTRAMVPRPQSDRGPWVAEALMNFTCDLDELSGLARVAAVLTKLGKLSSDELGEQGNHYRWNARGRLQLHAKKLEIRRFVAAVGELSSLADSYVRYLSAPREVRGEAPAGFVSVLSYSVGLAMRRRSGDTQEMVSQRQARLKRQLQAHRADLMCLQGLDPEDGDGANASGGAGVVAALAEESYAYRCARGSDGEANTIFFDRSRWELLSEYRCGAALAIDIRSLQKADVVLRIVCLRPQPHRKLRSWLLNTTSPVIVGADLSWLGGASGASVVADLVGLSSAAPRVLGAELAAPTFEHSNASGLRRLGHPDAMLYRDVAPVAMLSGHTEGYLTSLSDEEVAQQFPAMRLPLVTAFDWRTFNDKEAATTATSCTSLAAPLAPAAPAAEITAATSNMRVWI